jgi:hypothetical protein
VINLLPLKFPGIIVFPSFFQRRVLCDITLFLDPKNNLFSMKAGILINSLINRGEHVSSILHNSVNGCKVKKSSDYYSRLNRASITAAIMIITVS